ncbi:hypothetical protein MYX78_01000 [Acidobacteria bacterium AH-259-G07]|nr:hypothetical protein [Acidobacteria bacterium AH-259-G07]
MMEKRDTSDFAVNYRKASPRSIPAVSGVFDHGRILEMVYRPKDRETAFVLWDDGKWSYANTYSVDKKHCLIPYSPHNNLIKNEVVLLPSKPMAYESEESLVNEIQAFIHRYVDVSPLFEKIAAYYVLFTWIYDGFNELPYLKLRGDFGSGKTRFLLTVGSLCYKPIFASGASSVSPLFRILDIFRGTLIIDEADFRLSDERAEIVKILNSGNVKGFPVLRSEVVGKEFNPRAYHVFGPKIVATRGFFEDRALESRFLAEQMGQYRLRDDIPINLPSEYKEEALHIRNKLLLFRFRNLNKRQIVEDLVDRRIEPRLNQIFVPLLSIIEDAQAREELREVARQYNQELIAERGLEVEAQVLEIIQDMVSGPDKARLAVKDITSRFVDRHGEDYEHKITAKWIGSIIRKKLNLKTHKSHGIYVISPSQKTKLERLYEKYGISPKDDDETINKKAGP